MYPNPNMPFARFHYSTYVIFWMFYHVIFTYMRGWMKGDPTWGEIIFLPYLFFGLWAWYKGSPGIITGAVCLHLLFYLLEVAGISSIWTDGLNGIAVSPWGHLNQ